MKAARPRREMGYVISPAGYRASGGLTTEKCPNEHACQDE